MIPTMHRGAPITILDRAASWDDLRRAAPRPLTPQSWALLEAELAALLPPWLLADVRARLLVELGEVVARWRALP